MKIKSVRHDNRKKAFEVATHEKAYWFPFAKLRLRPTPANPVKSVRVDDELGNEAFTYELQSGEEGTVHIDQVLDYNRDPRYMRDLLLYKLTLAAQKRDERQFLEQAGVDSPVGDLALRNSIASSTRPIIPSRSTS